MAPWVPPIVAFGISLLTSTAGVSGAFLLLPFQVSYLGFTSPSVSSTNQLFNVVAIPSGVYRYIQEGRMVWPLTWAVVLGTLPGVFIGAIVRLKYLPDARDFKLFAAFVLFYIGSRLIGGLLQKHSVESNENAESRFRDLVRKHQRAARGDGHQDDHEPLPKVRVTKVSFTKIGYEFYGEGFDIPIWGVSSLSFIVGIVGGIYGIGGGAIIAPFFVSFFHLPVYTVAGAALMGTFVTSVAGVLFYQAVAPFYPTLTVAPDWSLGLLFGLGGMVGMYMGARLQKHVPARAIKWMLAGILMYTAVKYVLDYL